MHLHVSVENANGDICCAPEPKLVELSRANEASLSCMILLDSVLDTLLRAWVVDERGNVLCDSGRVALHDDEWVCLSSNALCTGDRLLSYTAECRSGWVVCFDVKERSDTMSMLKYIRLMRCKPPDTTAETTPSSEYSAKTTPTSEYKVRDEFASDSLDVLGVKGEDAPQHRVQRMFRQPSAQLLQAEFWRSLSVAGLKVLEPVPSVGLGVASDVDSMKRRRSELDTVGHSCLHAMFSTGACGVLDAVNDTIDALDKCGFPAVFIFMYDEIWFLLLQLFPVMESILGTSELDMALSVFAWALKSGDPGNKRVGSSFSNPHRDRPYHESHGNDGQLSMVTTWVALVPVTAENGCMYVVPSEKDELLTQVDDPVHMKPDEHTAWQNGLALPCDAGDVLMWQSNAIHWGSECAAGVAKPRKSISTMFMRHKAGVSNCIAKADLESGLSIEARLRIVMRALLIYKTHFPDFEGLAMAHDFS